MREILKKPTSDIEGMGVGLNVVSGKHEQYNTVKRHDFAAENPLFRILSAVAGKPLVRPYPKLIGKIALSMLFCEEKFL